MLIFKDKVWLKSINNKVILDLVDYIWIDGNLNDVEIIWIVNKKQEKVSRKYKQFFKQYNCESEKIEVGGSQRRDFCLFASLFIR